MKKILITIAFVAISIMSFAQMENIKLTSDSAVTVDKLYAGMLSTTLFTTDSLYANKDVNMRLGAAVTWQINPYIAFKTLGVFHSDVNNQYCVTHFYLKFTPSKLFTIQIGQTPTLSTEQRPNPASGAGQFETFSESQIPGTAPNIKVNVNPSSDLSFGIGTAVRKNKAEYHANVKFKNLVVSGYYSLHDEKAGAQASYYGKRIYDTFVWKQDQTAANIFCFNIVRKIKLTLYADIAYDLFQKKLIRAESGLLKNFESKYIKGLIGMGYCDEIHSIKGYLYIHL